MNTINNDTEILVQPISVEDFLIGDLVDVYANGNDDFMDFTGHVIGFHNNFVMVRDMDDDVFEVDAEQ